MHVRSQEPAVRIEDADGLRWTQVFSAVRSGYLLGMAAAAMLAGLFFALSLPATMMVKLSLDEIVGKADRIFVGRCTNIAEEEIEAGGGKLPCTVYTFETVQVLKGNLGKIVTVKHVGFRKSRAMELRQRSGGAAARFPFFINEMPEYRKGDEVLLFLNRENEHGLSAPIGLAQGAFYAVSDGHGRKIFLNRLGNAGLLDRGKEAARADLPAAPASADAAAIEKIDSARFGYRPFLELIRSLLGKERSQNPGASRTISIELQAWWRGNG